MKILMGLIVIALVGCKGVENGSAVRTIEPDLEPQPAPEVETMPHIVVYGDALALAVGNKMAESTDVENRAYEFPDAPANSAMMQGQQSIEQFPRYSPWDPGDKIIIMAGLFDAKGCNDTIDVNGYFEAAMRNFVEQALTKGVPVYVVIIPRIPAQGYAGPAFAWNTGNEAVLDWYAQLMRDVASDYDVQIIDLHANFPPVAQNWQANGYLLSDQGASTLAEMFLQAVGE